jgi:type II secretory pathway pseudopilin PulG
MTTRKLVNNEGFTLIEGIVAITLTLICVGFISSLLFSGFRAAALSTANEKERYRILVIDSAIRNAAAAVCIPYWQNSVDGVLTFISILDDKLAHSPDSESVVSVEPLSDSNGFQRGVDVVFRIGGKEYRSKALFSSIPVVEGKK